MALDDSRIGQDEYHLGLNVRNRFGDLRPVKRPLAVATGFPADVPFQGVYSVGDFLILIQGGDLNFFKFSSEFKLKIRPDSINSKLSINPPSTLIQLRQYYFLRSRI